MNITPERAEAARLAVMERMGWEDDRHGVRLEYQGACWDLAGQLVQAVVDALTAPIPARRAEGPLPRGRCGVCGREYALNADGRIRWHNDSDDRGRRWACVGSRHKPIP